MSREKEKISFVVSAKEHIWFQEQILSGIFSIIIYKADDGIVFGAVKLNPTPKWPRAGVSLGQT